MQSRPPRPLRSAVHAFLATNEAAPGSATAAAPAALTKLRERLGRVIGTMGFDGLLRRSVVLARARHPDAPLDEAALLAGGAQPSCTQDTDELVVSIVSNIVVLLATFIGDPLSRKILHEVWPSLATVDSDLAVEDEETSE